jgi:hypothetical protein
MSPESQVWGERMPMSTPHAPIPIGPDIGGVNLPYNNGRFVLDLHTVVFIHMRNVTFLSENVYIYENCYVLLTQDCHPRYWGMFYRAPPSITYEYPMYRSAVCIGHQHSSDFGHWFLEVLPAFAVVPREIIQRSVVVVPFAHPFVLDGFAVIGIPEKQVVAGDNAPFFAIDFYTMDFKHCSDLNQWLIIRFQDLLVKKFNIWKVLPTKYVTFNRPNMSRSIGNYEEVRQHLKERFPSISWEDGKHYKTLTENANYFQHFKLLFAVHGSLLGNIIFMQYDTAVIDLQMEQWLLAFLWLSAYTGKFMILGRDPRITWRGLTPNIISLEYVAELVDRALTEVHRVRPLERGGAHV